MRLESLYSEMDPASSFKLDLRPYQKQALNWMVNMERGDEAREGMSIHPLWQEYLFPKEPTASDMDPDEHFYYSPYSGEMSLNFPAASKKCRGGILAECVSFLHDKGFAHDRLF